MAIALFIGLYVGILSFYAAKMQAVLPPSEVATDPLPVFVVGRPVDTVFDWALASPDWVTIQRKPPKKAPPVKNSLVILNGAKR